MYAIIETGGKQYRVEPNEVLQVEKLAAAPGDMVEFDKVALVQDEGNITLGAPWVEGAKVTCKVLSQGRDRKIVVFTYKRRKQYKRKMGHRQSYTQVKVEKIGVAGAEG